MSKIKQPRYDASIEDGKIKLDDTPKQWKLVRERDSLTKLSADITWVEWKTNGQFNSKNDEIKIGRSLLMSPFNEFYTWLTTEITEIVVNEAD